MDSAHKVLIKHGNYTELFDFFTEKNSYVLIMSHLTLDLKLVVSLGRDRLYCQHVLRDMTSGRFSLGILELVDFSTIAELIDYYSRYYIFDRSGGLATRIRLLKPCYKDVMPLKYLCGVVIKKFDVEVPETVRLSLLDRPEHF